MKVALVSTYKRFDISLANDPASVVHEMRTVRLSLRRVLWEYEYFQTLKSIARCDRILTNPRTLVSTMVRELFTCV